MKKILVSILGIALTLSSFAHEGMWLPMFIKRLNHVDMQKEGLHLTAEELYSINSSSLKDAIVSLGGFCTAEVISSNGLMLTNHHCAYDAIQTHSTVENDFLTNGFWAKSFAEEKANEGLTASFLVRMEDVTARMMEGLSADMSEADRAAAIQNLGKVIVDEAIEGTNFNGQVKSFFKGNEFYLFLYETFTDVRLVGAPPSSVGKFGGDTDNWMWPRHTGDFSLLRVYSDKDGKPATYSEENIPLKPKHHLSISTDGVKEGDFAMIFGYPGSTDRYLTSFGVKEELDLHQPTVVEIRDKKLAIMKESMDSDPKLRIMYSSKYAQVANYWKYFIGQQEQLKRNKVYAKKQATETAFTAWMDQNPKAKAKYGEALGLIEEGYNAKASGIIGNTYLLEAGLTGSDAVLFGFRFSRMVSGTLKSGDAEKIAKAKEGWKAYAKKHFNEFHALTDERLFGALLDQYEEKVNPEQHPAFFAMVNKKYKGDFTRFAQKAYKTSILSDWDKMEKFIDNPSEKVLEKDMLISAANELIGIYFGIASSQKEAQEKLEKGNRLMVAGLREMNPEKKYYPDANSTMRMSYGKVGSYGAADAVRYNYYTTAAGITEKEDPNNPEFVVPEHLIDLIDAGDFGDYANEKGELVVNFITNNDITGGNSGSPVINGYGELIGCAFDGNWEAMSGDIAFEQELQRTICVDIRYILFIIDKYAGATNIIKELDFSSRKMQIETEEATK
ncbi:MAG: hypothetical protein ACJAY8_000268 [Sphingobacteriales bacterium]|jgi:hypothetical protein